MNYQTLVHTPGFRVKRKQSVNHEKIPIIKVNG